MKEVESRVTQFNEMTEKGSYLSNYPLKPQKASLSKQGYNDVADAVGTPPISP